MYYDIDSMHWQIWHVDAVHLLALCRAKHRAKVMMMTDCL